MIIKLDISSALGFQHVVSARRNDIAFIKMSDKVFKVVFSHYVDKQDIFSHEEDNEVGYHPVPP